MHGIGRDLRSLSATSHLPAKKIVGSQSAVWRIGRGADARSDIPGLVPTTAATGIGPNGVRLWPFYIVLTFGQ
jgi:hypothetical protein